jgi:predicted RNase H-like HicB family nuclease
MKLRIEADRDADGGRIAEVPGLPGVTTHGPAREDAVALVEGFGPRGLADRPGRGEAIPETRGLPSVVA